MWISRTKDDLIIEVWEKLDCESVGAVEIEAIEVAVEGRFGRNAVDSPMVIARLLADEGAVLRHSEILGLFVKRRSPAQHVALKDIEFDFENIDSAIGTVKAIETARRRCNEQKDDESARRLRDRVMEVKHRAIDGALNPRFSASRRAELSEIAEWLTIWLQTPEIFSNWLELRLNSRDFEDRFRGSIDTK